MTNTGFDVFDRTVQKSGLWLKEVNDAMGRDDIHKAYQALRAVLHTLRDRLTVNEAAALGAQLPLLIRGMYYEGFKPAQMPVKIRKKDDFIAHVMELIQPVPDLPPNEAIEAVMTVLQKRVTDGEIQDIQKMMPEELQSVWPHSE